MNKRNKYSHPHIYSLVYQPVSHTHTHTHTHTHSTAIDYINSNNIGHLLQEV